MTYALAAAGTGGHVYPAISVAQALLASGVARDEIVFFGGDRMESTAVPAAGFTFVAVEIRGLRRSLSAANLTLPMVVARASREIRNVMALRRTRVLTVFGGYVSVPAAWAAVRSGIGLLVQEQNAVPGLANRIVARKADASFVAFPAAAVKLPRSRLIGNPLRSEFATFNRTALRPAALRRYDLPADRPVLGVLGGSLGAKVLNEATATIAAGADPGSLSILHLTGRSHLDDMQRRSTRSSVTWRTLPFEESMVHFYAAADLVLSRAGALTISELAATGSPAVVVPYAAGTAAHQEANASHLADEGGVIVVAEAEVQGIGTVVTDLLADRARLRMMGEASRSAAHTDAADVIAAEMRARVDG